MQTICFFRARTCSCRTSVDDLNRALWCVHTLLTFCNSLFLLIFINSYEKRQIRKVWLNRCVRTKMDQRSLSVAHVISRDDRRRWQRLPIPVPMFVSGVDERGKGFLEFSTGLNISAGGALMVTRRHLPRSSKVSLQIPTPPFPKQVSSQVLPRKLKARVVRVRNADGYYLSGLAFSRPLVVV